MSGIYGLLNYKHKDRKLYKYFSSYSSINIINEEIKSENHLLGRSVLNKFNNDRIFKENDQYIICFEGLCFNKKLQFIEQLLKIYGSGDKFAEELNGVFSGFIYNKSKKKITIFNDHLATKPIYYYFNQEKQFFVFSSEMKMITALLKRTNIKYSINCDGVYSLLSFGYFINDLTSVNEIKKLPFGSTLEYDCNSKKVTMKNHISYSSEYNNKQTIKEQVLNIDELFTNSVKSIWNKDMEYNYKHQSLLSGGLDAKTNLLVAHKEGFKNIRTITFSQNGTEDQKIPQKIAVDYNFNHIFITLNKNLFLNCIDKYVQSTESTVLIHSATHLFNSLLNLDFNNYGVLHTGQLGNTVFGTFFHNKFSYRYYKFTNNDFFKKISHNLFDSKLTHNTTEKLGIEQRIINGSLIGDKCINNITDTSSPFYNLQLIKYTFSIPPKHKIHNFLYFKWLTSKQREIAKYKWDYSGIPLYNYTLTKYCSLYRRIKNKLSSKLNNYSYHMSPVLYWIEKSPEVQYHINSIYNRDIEKIQQNELRKDMKLLFNSNNTTNKIAVLTVLLNLKLHGFFD